MEDVYGDEMIDRSVYSDAACDVMYVPKLAYYTLKCVLGLHLKSAYFKGVV